MSDLTIIESSTHPALVVPRIDLQIRGAEECDLPFIDRLQKKTSNQVGFMPTKQLEGKIKAGHVTMAETREGVSAGYLIACDRYFKRDDVGIIYQINVAEAFRRSLVAASLLKAQFEASAYGCRLYCCWCAQDIEANRFWESMGFAPLAYRAGSPTRGKKKTPRVHIFWQKRIRGGDTTTPWWFPSQTSGGSIREDRLVLPIRPGMHWSDEQPLLLPAVPVTPAAPLRLEDDAAKAREKRAAKTQAPSRLMPGGLRMADPAPAKKPAEKPTPAEKPKRVKAKNDPKLVAAARELRDRWLEDLNSVEVPTAARYDVTRAMESERNRRTNSANRLIEAA